MRGYVEVEDQCREETRGRAEPRIDRHFRAHFEHPIVRENHIAELADVEVRGVLSEVPDREHESHREQQHLFSEGLPRVFFEFFERRFVREDELEERGHQMDGELHFLRVVC